MVMVTERVEFTHHDAPIKCPQSGHEDKDGKWPLRKCAPTSDSPLNVMEAFKLNGMISII